MYDKELPAISNVSNLLALVYHALPHLNWVGLYLYDTDSQDCLLGPFQGKAACTRIPLGKGVVGTCAKEQKLLIVDDVHQFPGHIACDSDSASELVAPIYKNQQLFAILDIDSTIPSRFKEPEQEFFQFLAHLLSDILTADLGPFF